MIDIHAHALPFVDDGSDSIKDSIALLKEEALQGVTDVILTPHYRNAFVCAKQELLERFNQLKEVARAENLNLNLHLGQEIYYTSLTKQLLDADKLLTLANSKYVLVEFSFDEDCDISEVVYELRKKGYLPIVAHPERYPYFTLSDAIEIKELGGLLQINATSIVGERKRPFSRKAKAMLKQGLVDFVASDVHVGRKNLLKKANAFIVKKYGQEYADLIFLQNANKIIKG